MGASGRTAAASCPLGVTALEILTSKSYVVATVSSFVDQTVRMSSDNQVLVGWDHAAVGGVVVERAQRATFAPEVFPLRAVQVEQDRARVASR
jgi:hypothetical protein